MERKVLTYDDNGVRRDFIPYVDDLSVMIGGTNLRDYLAQIEENIQRALLFLGAFESEEALLQKYPNGTELTKGTYAIVADEDALYIYDTDTLRWIKTASATIGVLQLNGLNPVNGSLVITGGDINAIVPNAPTESQTITAHLNELYGITNLHNATKSGIVAIAHANDTTSVGDNVTFNATFGMNYKDSKLYVTKLNRASSVPESIYDKGTKINIKYADGETKVCSLATADGGVFTYRNAIDLYGYQFNPYVLLYVTGNVAYILTTNEKSHSQRTDDYLIRSANWVDNEEGTGYKYVVDINPRAYRPNVLSVYKEISGARTKAVVDYKITGNVVTIISDETFEGGVVISYTYQ